MEQSFSNRIKEVITYSREEALRLGHAFIGTEHLLLGIIREGEGGAVDVLTNLQVELISLRERIEDFGQKNNIEQAVSKKQLPLTKQAEKALKTTFLEARKFESSVIGTAHLLLCVLRNFDDPITKILNEFDITYETVKNEYNNYLFKKEQKKNF